MLNKSIQSKVCIKCGVEFFQRPNTERYYMFLKRPFCSRSCSRKDKPLSVISKQKISNTKKGCIPWNKGKKGVQIVSEVTRAKLSIARLGNQNAAGSKNWSWKGGIAKINTKNGVYTKRRRARKRGADGSHTQAEWDQLKQQYEFICVFCKRPEPEIILTRDHIIPLIKGGSDYITNIQPLCRSCNSRKGPRLYYLCSPQQLLRIKS